jgi:integrase
VSIRKLPSGAYQARLMLNGRTVGATFTTRDDAKDWELITRARAASGALPRRTTVREYAEIWLAGYDHAPRNTRNFHADGLKHIKAALGSAPVSEVTPSDITRMLNRLIETRTPALAERVYRTSSALFASAAADGLCPSGSPVRSKRHRPRRQREPKPVLERDQARRMLAELTGWHRDTAVVQLALGARFGEIAGLTPHDVNLARGVVHIRRRYSAHTRTIRATKNHRRRTLELPRLLYPTLERLLDTAGDPPPLPDLLDRELEAEPFRGYWLIQVQTGRPPALTSYNRKLAEACEALGVPTVSSHGLRHSYVSWMIDDGHSADKIAFWIGDTPMTVRLVYAHMLEESSAPAAATMDAALGGFDR